MSWQQRVDDALTARRATDTLRRRYVVSQGAGRWLVANGRQYLNFSSNDYLGLSQHPQIIRAWQQAATRFGVGSGGAGPISGFFVAAPAVGGGPGEMVGIPPPPLVYFCLAAETAGISPLM